jgi:hypothetical protein
MEKFTVTGINYDGGSLFLHLEARDLAHAEALLRALPLQSPWLLLSGHVQAADGRHAQALTAWMAANGGVDSFTSYVVHDYLAWYNDPSRLFSPTLTLDDRRALTRQGEAAGFPCTRLVDEGGYYTVVYTAEPGSRMYTDRVLGLLQPGDKQWQVCLYRPKAYLEQYGTSYTGYRVVSEHTTAAQALAAMLAGVGFEQDIERLAA